MTAFADLIAPIPGDNPSGVELRYEPVYDEIKEARKDDGDLPPKFEGDTPKRADWAKVAKLAEGALAKKSKDLQLVAWLAEARLHKDGFQAFAEALQLARTLVEDFWETVHPELDGDDADFRAAPLNWIGTQLDMVVQMVPINEAGHGYLSYRASRDVPTREAVEGDSDLALKREEAALTPEDAEAGNQKTSKAWFKALVAGLEASRAELKALGASCGAKFATFEPNDQVPPRFSETGIALESVQKLAAQLLAQKLEVDPDPIDPTAIPTGDVGMPSEPTTGPPTSREDACSRVAVAARYLREEDSTDPAPYLMVRGLRWGELRVGGNSLDPRLLLAPPTATRTHLKGLLLDGAWAQLLEAGEEIMASPFGRGWLDLQRYVLTATDSLGGGYEPVGAAIRGSLSALLRDMPDLAEATLMDDTPTANRETRGWLRDENLFGAFTDDAEGEMGGGAAPAPTSREADSVARVLGRARSEAQAGRHEKAMKLVQARAAAEANPRNRFLLKTESAAIMVEGGHHTVALPILHELYEEMATAQMLVQWEEPSVVARPMGLLYKCSLITGDTSVDADSLYLEVCKLDPMMAIELQQAASQATASEGYSGEEGDGG